MNKHNKFKCANNNLNHNNIYNNGNGNNGNSNNGNYTNNGNNGSNSNNSNNAQNDLINLNKNKMNNKLPFVLNKIELKKEKEKENNLSHYKTIIKDKSGINTNIASTCTVVCTKKFSNFELKTESSKNHESISEDIIVSNI